MTPIERQLLARIDALESLVTRSDPANQRVFLAIEGATETQWQEQVIANGEVADFVDGRACESDSAKSALVDIGDSFIVVQFVDGRSNCMRYVKVGGGSGTTFMVALTHAAGADGAAPSTACSWTYNVSDAITGESLATGASPVGQRWKVAGVAYGTYGIGWYDSNDALKFVVLDELPSPELCA
jgi:hypothetical protein